MGYAPRLGLRTFPIAPAALYQKRRNGRPAPKRPMDHVYHKYMAAYKRAKRLIHKHNMIGFDWILSKDQLDDIRHLFPYYMAKFEFAGRSFKMVDRHVGGGGRGEQLAVNAVNTDAVTSSAQKLRPILGEEGLHREDDQDIPSGVGNAGPAPLEMTNG